MDDIHSLETGNMSSLSKEQSILSRETIQNVFVQNYAPFQSPLVHSYLQVQNGQG